VGTTNVAVDDGLEGTDDELANEDSFTHIDQLFNVSAPVGESHNWSREGNNGGWGEVREVGGCEEGEDYWGKGEDLSEVEDF